MRIVNRFQETELLEKVSAMEQKKTGESIPVLSDIVEEHTLHIYINDILTLRLACTPQYLEELVIGRLISDGSIRTADEIDVLYICEHGQYAKVFLQRREAISGPGHHVESVPTCCTGNKRLNGLFLPEGMPEPKAEQEPLRGEDIFRLYEAFQEDAPLHSATHGSHLCLLMCRGDICFACEDIGRHNALDKAIGYAAKEKLMLRHCILFTSGRVAEDMAMKTIWAGGPTLVSKEKPTAKAIALGKEYGVRIITAKKDSFTVWT